MLTVCKHGLAIRRSLRERNGHRDVLKCRDRKHGGDLVAREISELGWRRNIRFEPTSKHLANHAVTKQLSKLKSWVQITRQFICENKGSSQINNKHRALVAHHLYIHFSMQAQVRWLLSNSKKFRNLMLKFYLSKSQVFEKLLPSTRFTLLLILFNK